MMDGGVNTLLFGAKEDVSATDEDDGVVPVATTLDSTNALILAAQQGQVDVVECLLRQGIDFAQQDKHGRTALYHAYQNGHAKVVNLLLRYCYEMLAKYKTSEEEVEYVSCWPSFVKKIPKLCCCGYLSTCFGYNKCKCTCFDVDE